MLLKFKGKDSELISNSNFAVKLKESAAKQDFLLMSVKTLLQFIKEFALDIKEIKSEKFKSDISNISNRFADETKLKKIQSLFDREKKGISSYIKQQKKYIFDRESELKDIINILTSAVVNFDTENQEYNQKILDQSERIEKITHLDDIKKIKQELIQEIEQMRETVRKKQSRDNKQIEVLSEKVQTLNVELKKVRTESVIDGLTGIFNRKAFDEFITEMVQKNTVTSFPFALLMLDIDNFKSINDNYGHSIGDRVIMATTNKCSQSIRGDDYFARYGGEEFAIILPGASLKNAAKKAKVICEAVASTSYFLDDLPGNPTLSVTVSIGVSTYHKADTVFSVIKRADSALYNAKRNGKNCVSSEKDLQ